tara:strand:- start:895 stop:1494 length:600 start_codon:yes stop_codon:yes gene_type:complete
LASFKYPNQIYPKTVGAVIKATDLGGMLSEGVVQNTYNLRTNYIQEGISAAPIDVDNLVRRIPLLLKTPDGLRKPHKIQTALSESILIENFLRIICWSLAAEILIFGIFVSLTWLVIKYLNMVNGLGMVVILLFTTSLSGAFSIQKGVLIDFSWTFISQIITSTIPSLLTDKNYSFELKLLKPIAVKGKEKPLCIYTIK